MPAVYNDTRKFLIIQQNQALENIIFFHSKIKNFFNIFFYLNNKSCNIFKLIYVLQQPSF